MEAVPADPARNDDVTRVLAPFGATATCPHYVDEASPCAWRAVEPSLAEVVRALDAEDIEIAHLQLHAPSLDDVFLAKTGRTLEGAGEEEEEA